MTSPLDNLARTVATCTERRPTPPSTEACCIPGMYASPMRWRYIVFQVLPHTLGLGPEVWRVLAKCHQIRNQGEYEGDLDIDEGLVRDLTTAGRRVLNALEDVGEV